MQKKSQPQAPRQTSPHYPEQAAATAPAVREDAAAYRFLAAYQAEPRERIAAIRAGIPAGRVDALARSMGVPKESLVTALGLARATVSRKIRAGATLGPEESERLLGVEALIGQVQAMVAESGDPAGFNAARWMARWINGPVPALGGSTPASYLDTVEGQKVIAQLLAMMQSGAYA